jgi:hypothetical protein
MPRNLALYIDYILRTRETITTKSGKKLKIIRIQDLQEFLLLKQIERESTEREIEEVEREEIEEELSIIEGWMRHIGLRVEITYYKATGIITVTDDEKELRKAKEMILKIQEGFEKGLLGQRQFYIA